MTGNWVAKQLKVIGMVQGVGFRFFIFQLAEQYGLKGQVANTSSGVVIPLRVLPRKLLLLKRGFVALVMTSGNLGDEPIAIDNEDAFEWLACIADKLYLYKAIAQPLTSRAAGIIAKRN